MKAASKKKTKAKTVKEVKAMTAEESRNRAQSLCMGMDTVFEQLQLKCPARTSLR